MATVASVARDRKQQLRQLMIASRRLDAEQEKLEREIKRITNRKKGVPELADADRISVLAQSVESSLASIASIIEAVSQSWGSIT